VPTTCKDYQNRVLEIPGVKSNLLHDNHQGVVGYSYFRSCTC